MFLSTFHCRRLIIFLIFKFLNFFYVCVTSLKMFIRKCSRLIVIPSLLRYSLCFRLQTSICAYTHALKYKNPFDLNEYFYLNDLIPNLKQTLTTKLGY